MLSDVDIKEAIEKEHIKIEPYNEKDLQPSSYDLTLGQGFKKIKKDQIITFSKKAEYIDIDDPIILLKPNDFVLATTVERVALSNQISAQISGKSSWGRKGLKIENAGYVDAGFKGQLTLEILNEGDAVINLTKGCKICQIIFEELKTPAKNSYNGKYQNQKGVTGSREETHGKI